MRTAYFHCDLENFPAVEGFLHILNLIQKMRREPKTVLFDLWKTAIKSRSTASASLFSNLHRRTKGVPCHSMSPSKKIIKSGHFLLFTKFN